MAANNNMPTTRSLEVLLISEAGLHSAAAIAETILELEVQVDLVLHIGSFIIGDYETPESENGDARKAVNYQMLGEITTIISQLENIGRVVYLENDTISGGGSPSLTSDSSNANGHAVEVAAALFVTGCTDRINDDERTELLNNVHSLASNVLKPRHESRSDNLFSKSSVILLENNECPPPTSSAVEQEVVLHVSIAPKRNKHSKISNETTRTTTTTPRASRQSHELPLSLSNRVVLKPLWASGMFTTVSLEQGSIDGEWKMVHRQDHSFDVLSYQTLPFQR
jgi:hypothetical protein